MLLLTKQTFKELADYQGTHLVSIYLPTHRAGMEVNRREDEILLKKQLKTVARDLEALGFSKLEVEDYLRPAYTLLENSTFWNNLSDGLALFLGDQYFKYYTLPIHFGEFIYINDHFYLRPFMPLYNENGRFFLLALSLDEVRFYEGSRYHIAEVHIEDLLPKRLKEVVGSDFKQKTLQFHSTQRGSGGAIFHGRGEGKDEDKDEIKRFFKAVNDGLMNLLHDEKAPMVIACVDYLFPIYQAVNIYPNLYDKNIDGSPDRVSAEILHKKAWDTLTSTFCKEREEKVSLFKELMSTERVATQLEDILPAALSGKVDTLFLQNRQDAYGVFEPTTQSIRWADEKKPGNTSLTNLAAIKTFDQGGKVFLMEPEDMPMEGTLANAIFRF